MIGLIKILWDSIRWTRSTDNVEVETSPDRQKTETPDPHHDLDDQLDGTGAPPREPLFAAVLREVAAERERERVASEALDGATSRNFGYLPREVTADQVHLILENDINPFTNQPHTEQYKKILEARKTLPVFAHMADFYKIVSFMHTSPHPP